MKLLKPLLFTLLLALGSVYIMFDDKELLNKIIESKNHSNPSSLFEKDTEYAKLKIKGENITNSYLLNSTIDKMIITDVDATGVTWENLKVNGGSIKNSRFIRSHFKNVTFTGVTLVNFNASKSSYYNVVFENCEILDERGPHAFFGGFSFIKGDKVTFKNCIINGLAMVDSDIDVVFEGVQGRFIGPNLINQSSMIIKDSNMESFDGQSSKLSQLIIDSSTFADSKLNNITAQTVKLNNLMGQLSVTGNLGDVEVTRLNTEPGEALYMGDSTIRNALVQNCDARTKLNFMDSLITSLSVKNCSISEFWLNNLRSFKTSIQHSTYDNFVIKGSIIKDLNIENLTVNKRLAAKLSQAEKFDIGEFSINPAATIEVEGSNISWKPFSTNKK
jgi:uncharacterized protein YjbI with pentapeptide repeats